MADHKTEHLPGAGASLHHYVRGLILSVLLTGAAFALVMTGALPRNATGKVLKNQLRAEFGQILMREPRD